MDFVEKYCDVYLINVMVKVLADTLFWGVMRVLFN